MGDALTQNRPDITNVDSSPRSTWAPSSFVSRFEPLHISSTSSVFIIQLVEQVVLGLFNSLNPNSRWRLDF